LVARHAAGVGTGHPAPDRGGCHRPRRSRIRVDQPRARCTAPVPAELMAAMHHAGLQEDFYPDILRGIATYLDSGFVARVARTARRYPSPDLANALNRKQIACKKWLVDEVAETFGPDLGCVWVLGGWYGVLPALMFDDARIRVERIVNVDLDE